MKVVALTDFNHNNSSATAMVKKGMKGSIVRIDGDGTSEEISLPVIPGISYSLVLATSLIYS